MSAKRSRRDMEAYADVLVIAPWFEGGGAQAALTALMRASTGLRFDVLVLFNGNRNWEPVAEASERVEFLNAPRTARGAVLAASGLMRRVRHYRTVYSLMRASHVVLGMVPLVPPRVRLAATFHQLPSSDREEGGIKPLLEELLVRRALRRARLVTAPSKRAVEEIAMRRLASSTALRHEENLIEADQRPPLPVEPHDGIRLLAVGRLTRQKGFDLLPALLRGVTGPLELRLIGDGEERDALMAMPWPDHVQVEFLGHVTDVATHIDWTDAVVMPSRQELNPLVVWEAWGRGRPVLANDIPVMRDLAQSGPLRIFESETEFSAQLAPGELSAFQKEAWRSGPDTVARQTVRSELQEFFQHAR